LTTAANATAATAASETQNAAPCGSARIASGISTAAARSASRQFDHRGVSHDGAAGRSYIRRGSHRGTGSFRSSGDAGSAATR
jgi:hypothetical protein